MTMQGIAANDVLETTETQGTGNYALEGPVVPYGAFSAAIGHEQLVTYVCQQLIKNGEGEVTGKLYERGLGRVHHGAPDEIERVDVFESSNGDAAVDWGPGTKTIFATPLAQNLPMMAEPLAAARDGRPLVVAAGSRFFAPGNVSLGQQAATTLTIASDAITPTQAWHTVDTESAAASDDIASIATANIADGGLLLLSAVNAGRVPTVKHQDTPSAGQIYLQTGSDFALSGTRRALLLQRRGDHWVEICRGRNVNEIAEAFILSGVLTPAQLTANQDNYNPTGLATAAVLRMSTNASRNVTGIAGGSNGRMLLVGNVGSNNLVLVHDATSTAANRFSLPGAANLTLLPGEWALLRYDATLSRWIVVASTAPTRAATETNAGAAALAAQAEAEAGTNDTKALTPLKLRQGLRAGGSAPVYAARAWVNFDGTLSSGNIRNSGNVSSVTRHATGDFSVNFATALPHADYAAIAMAGGVALDDSGTAKSTSAFRYSTRNLGGTFINWANNGVVIFC